MTKKCKKCPSCSMDMDKHEGRSNYSCKYCGCKIREEFNNGKKSVKVYCEK